MPETKFEQQTLEFQAYLAENAPTRLKELLANLSESGTRHVATLIRCYVQPDPRVREAKQIRQQEAKGKQKGLSKAIEALKTAASAYNVILTVPYNQIVLTPLPDNIESLIALPAFLQREAERLDVKLSNMKPLSQIKRYGAEEYVCLLSLQSFVRQWTGQEDALSIGEIAILIDAGLSAFASQCNSPTDPETLGKAIRRIRRNPANESLCRIVERRESDNCKSLQLGLPLPFPL